MNITAVLRDSFDVMKKNWVLFVPFLAAFVLMALISLITVGSMVPFGDFESMGTMSQKEAIGVAGTSFVVFFIMMVLSGIIGLLAHGMTITMIDDALKTEKATLSGGWTKTLQRIFPLLIAAVLVGLIVSIGFILLVLPGIVAIFFLMFSIIAVITNQTNGFAALAHSARTVFRNIKATIVLFLVLIALGVLFAIVSVILGLIPILGVILSIAASAIFGVYTTIFLVISYNKLETEPDTQPDATI
ncbi:MAG: hypothetical protein K9L66_12745 [Spirochaetaceae bacterium]|nr:hypothetical protein [Spirochaetaceae bacterium]